MNDAKKQLWPFGVKMGLLTTVALLVGLLVIVPTLRSIVGWPSDKSEPTLLIGILALSLLPIALVLIDAVIDRAPVIEYGGVKLAFSQGKDLGTGGLTIQANIGVRGVAVADSGTTQVLDTLKQAATQSIAIVDLEDGQAWWETRLLVLLAGAERRGRPDKIVFVGNDAGKEQQFQGWAGPRELLPLIVSANPSFPIYLRSARAAAAQIALIEPDHTPNRSSLGPVATRYEWMSSDPTTGQSNEVFAEQVLQSELGHTIEQQGGARSVNLVRLEELFRPVMHKECIDLTWAAERQLETFLSTEGQFLAITQGGKYVALVERLTLLNQLLKPLMKGDAKRSSGRV